ncbi:hypothetical protein BS47DRAFT_1309594, partial [Hydnum rufescens UP504]
CTKCNPTFRLDQKKVTKIIEHSSTHILWDPTIAWEDEPCGFFLRPAPQCLIYHVRGRGAHSALHVDVIRSHGCPAIGNFSYKKASQSTAGSPCSNVPLKCPQCPASDPAIWRYNIPAHFAKEHASADAQEYLGLSTLSLSETDSMRIIWNNR